MPLAVVIIVWQMFVFTACKSKDPHEYFFPITPNFDKVVKTKYYIDKTMFIKEFKETEKVPIFIAAPKGFGKSVTVQMLKRFFEIQLHSDGTKITDNTKAPNFELFNNTNIYKLCSNFFNDYFGLYPVIHVDYEPLVHVSDYKSMLNFMTRIFRQVYTEHSYLATVDGLWDKDQDRALFNRFIANSGTLELRHFKQALPFLCKVLFMHYKKKPIILIDNYAAYIDPMIFASQTDHSAVVKLFNDAHKQLFQDAKHLVENAFFTGYFHTIKRQSTKRLKLYYVLQEKRYSKYFGLMEHEIADLLRRFTNKPKLIDKLREQIEQYYKGFAVLEPKAKWKAFATQPSVQETTYIYNIHSIVRYLQNRKGKEPRALKNYFPRHRYYDEFVRICFDKNTKLSIILLLNNRQLKFLPLKVFTESEIQVLRELITTKHKLLVVNFTNHVFHYLIHIGYVTYADHTLPEDGRFLIKIPNYEMRHVMENLLLDSAEKQFSFTHITISEFVYIVDEVYDESCTQLQFHHIYSLISEILMNSTYDVASQDVFQMTIYSMFGYKMRDKMKLAEESGHFVAQIYNQRWVLFMFYLNDIIDKETIDVEEMRTCAKLGAEHLLAGKHVDKSKQQLVYFGICLGFERDKDGTLTGKRFSMAYTKNLRPEDNVNDPIVLADFDAFEYWDQSSS